ncbi:phosphoglycerate kinase, cytosolic-like [Cicer arietinum]|uniref:Phosphoglycerate kinase n=1 Tax=Cicer arietinum TaxID=3827 RepID=A0A1S2YTS4_CICAR|nr:phosphoglycerate kinase, cytosolic-like [Cicer arietinum]
MSKKCDDRRPNGVTPKYSLKPLMPRLCELLGVEVKIVDDCIGEEVEKLVAQIPKGGVLLLENARFHKEKEKNDPEFAKLASLVDLYVNDAFGTAHRAHVSTEGVTKYLKPSVAGFLCRREIDYLVRAVANQKKPFVAIVGGSKVSSKIDNPVISMFIIQIFGDSKPFEDDEMMNVRQRCANLILELIENV